jgi:hypothetical protein
METTVEYRQFFFDLRGKLLTSQITYEQALEMAKPVLVEYNKKGEAIAKKYGKKYRKITPRAILRGGC